MSGYGWYNNHFNQNSSNMYPYPGGHSMGPSMGSSSYHWVNSYRGREAPPNAVCCGVDRDGSEIYVGQAFFSGDELPAKIIPRRREAYICYDGREIPITDYKILVESKLQWVHSSMGHIPPGAVAAGRTSHGEVLYVGRRRVEGSAMAVGKVHSSHGCLYVPYAGKEMSFRDYEILVYK